MEAGEEEGRTLGTEMLKILIDEGQHVGRYISRRGGITLKII